MISLNVRNINLLLSYILLANVQSSKTTTSSTLESEINDVVTEFINQPIRNNETLLKEVAMAIENVLLQKKHYELEFELQLDTIKEKLKPFFKALCIHKAGALIDSIEEKLRPKLPEFCEHCLDWGHEKTNCTNEKPVFGGSDEQIKERVHVQRNRWYWMLRHLRDDVDIGRLSDYLEQVYIGANFTILFNTTDNRKPKDVEKFKLLICFSLGEILQERKYITTWYRNQAYWQDLSIEDICIQKFIEIFLKALDKWVDFEEPVLLQRDDSFIENENTTIMGSLELNIDKVIQEFIDEDISSNETLLQEVKNAIQHVLLKKRNVQLQIRNTLNLYKTKLRTFFKALCIYKLAAILEKPNIDEYPEEKPPLCSRCLNWNHTADKCNSSEIAFGGNVSISRDVYSWYWMLAHLNLYPFESKTKPLLQNLPKAYDNENYTNTFEPKPENFRQFKLIFCQAMAKIYQYVNYLSTSYRNEPQMKEFNFYGVSLFELVIILYRITGYTYLADEFVQKYNEI